jgi:signal transduction histidine kinase
MEITTSENQLKITITDNGHGFSPANPTEGNGLLNLQERLANIGGQCQITSLPGTGTTVSFAFPLPAN